MISFSAMQTKTLQKTLQRGQNHYKMRTLSRQKSRTSGKSKVVQGRFRDAVLPKFGMAGTWLYAIRVACLMGGLHLTNPPFLACPCTCRCPACGSASVVHTANHRVDPGLVTHDGCFSLVDHCRQLQECDG